MILDSSGFDEKDLNPAFSTLSYQRASFVKATSFTFVV